MTDKRHASLRRAASLYGWQRRRPGSSGFVWRCAGNVASPVRLSRRGGGLRRQAGVGVLLASRGWAGQTPPTWHGGEPLPRPCHTRRLSLLSLHLHSLSSSTLPPFIYSFLHLSPLVTSFNPLFFIATLYCHYSLLPHLAYQNRPLLKVIHHLQTTVDHLLFKQTHKISAKRNSIPYLTSVITRETSDTLGNTILFNSKR